MKKDAWTYNALLIRNDYGGFVDFKEKYYICPECGELVYKDDWEEIAFMKNLCPICEFAGN